MSVSPQILQQWISLKMTDGKAPLLITDWKIMIKKENPVFLRMLYFFPFY